ncbi:glycosyltransferase family 39 protein [Myxococcota bacterium]|nr:glycosyltransferase family 39 protein [Myxococcota bacterium]
MNPTLTAMSELPRASTEGSEARRWLWVVLGVALLARCLAAWVFRDVQAPVYDERYYTHVGESIARGFGHPGAFRPPLYAFFIAQVFRFSMDLDVLRAVQIALSLLPVAFAFQVCLRRFGLRAGIGSGLACALCPPLLHFSHFLWSESLAVVLVTGFFWFLDIFDRSEQRRYLFAAGLMLGLLALTREIWIYFGPVMVGWLWARAGWRWRVAGPAIASLLLGMVLTVGPWTLRNQVTLGKFVLISTNHWRPLADGNLYPPDRWFLGQNPKAQREALNEKVRAMPREEAQAYLRGLALRRIADDQPWWLFKKLVRNSSMLYSVVDQELQALEKGWIRLSTAGAWLLVATTLVGFFATMIPGILGLWLVPGGWFKGLVVLAILFVNAAHVVSVAVPRYLVPLLPLFLLMAGPLLAGAWSHSRTARWRWAGAWASVAAFVLIPLPRAVVAAKAGSFQSTAPVSTENVRASLQNAGHLGTFAAPPLLSRPSNAARNGVKMQRARAT